MYILIRTDQNGTDWFYIKSGEETNRLHLAQQFPSWQTANQACEDTHRKYQFATIDDYRELH